jgi:CRP/FNR family cyclic AMP-dependent transcriptional regulator
MSERRFARRALPLLDLDPDLGRLLSAERRAAAARLMVAVHELDEGPLDLARLQTSASGHLGLLLIDGVITREVALGTTFSTELLGPGDIVRPWGEEEDAVELLETSVRWTVLSEAAVALLDRHSAVALCAFPELYVALVDRLGRRSTRLATTQAISQTTRVDRRLIALFWHLAERWGRMTPDGIQVPLRLSHRLLGQLVGARRPTVSSALTMLARRGELVRRHDGSWLLPGRPLALAWDDAADGDEAMALSG